MEWWRGALGGRAERRMVIEGIRGNIRWYILVRLQAGPEWDGKIPVG